MSGLAGLTHGEVPAVDVEGSIAMFALENRNKPLIVVSESHPILEEEWSGRRRQRKKRAADNHDEPTPTASVEDLLYPPLAWRTRPCLSLTQRGWRIGKRRSVAQCPRLLSLIRR